MTQALYAHMNNKTIKKKEGDGEIYFAPIIAMSTLEIIILNLLS
jgi:hypothetical protein